LGLLEYHGLTYIDGRDIIICTDLGDVYGVSRVAHGLWVIRSGFMSSQVRWRIRFTHQISI